MEIRISKSEKDGQEKNDSSKSTVEDMELPNLNNVKHNNVMVLNVKQPNSIAIRTQEPFLRHIQSLDRRLPKNIITLDEKYLRRCLELVYATALKGASCNNGIFESLPFQISTLSEGANSLELKSRFAYDLCESVTYLPQEATVIGSKSGISLQKVPLFRQSGMIENAMDINERTYLIDAIRSADDSYSLNSPPSISSSQKTAINESTTFRSETRNKRFVSIDTSTISDESSSSSSDTLTRGMLRRKWNAGLLQYVFSLDDDNKVYIASLIKCEPPNDDVHNYIYTFHTNGQNLVGRLRVSTSFKLCPNNSKIKETEFVLFGEDNTDTGEEIQSLASHKYKRCRMVSKKISGVFMSNQSSRYTVTNENPIVDLSTDYSNYHFSPNLELAAIIVKDHVCRDPREEPEIGGWGLKFLKKNESKTSSLKDNSHTPCNGNCSTSMNIITPVGYHGGPRNKISGPSSLVDRWRSGGRCDCGGWDIGCPITIVDTKLSKEETTPVSFTIHTQASKVGSVPMLKMVNIQDGSYAIHFQSSLSSLQSLSVAMAIIHTQTVQYMKF